MSNYQFDAETKQHFAKQREANARKLQLEQEREERLRQEFIEDAKRRAEAERRQTAEKLESDLRAAFFKANPTANAADYERLAPQLRDQHMLASAAPATANVFDQIRLDAEKRRQEELDRRTRFMQLPQGA